MCDICVTYLPNESPYLLDLCFFHSEFEPKFLRPEAIFGPGIPDSLHGREREKPRVQKHPLNKGHLVRKKATYHHTQLVLYIKALMP